MPRAVVTPTVTIQDYGRGRNTQENPNLIGPGEARDSQNFHHNVSKKTAKVRSALDRVWATRPANAVVLGTFQYNKNDGTTKRIAKVGGNLYSFTLTPTDALTSLIALGDSTHIPQFAQANNFFYMADWANKNYISDGTSSNTYELQKTAPTGNLSLASAGAAVGNPAGDVYYSYTDVDPTTGMESPPRTVGTTLNTDYVVRTVDQGVTVSNSSLSFTAPFTQKNLYRTKVGDTSQFWRVTTGLTSGSFPYSDVSLDDNLTTASEVHDENGIASIEKPEAAKHVIFHRGRLFIANLNGKPSRLRWSKPLEPTQWSNSTTSLRDIGKDDGGEITGLVSFRGALVIFKTNDIYVMNGDDDELNFVVQKVVSGVGCVAPRSIATDGETAIYYLSACGVYGFTLGNNRRVSDNIAPDLDSLSYASRQDFFCAALNQCDREYILSVTPSGGSTNTKTHVYSVDTAAWGRFRYGMGTIVPSSYSDEHGPIRNSTGRIKTYVGDTNGYLYEMEASTFGDGVTSGTVTGTITARSPTTVTVATASFRTTGDTLKGIPLTLVRAADGSIETVEITSNTGTVITHAAFSGTASVIGDTIYVGAIEAILSLGRSDARAAGIKRWHDIAVLFEKQSHGVPLRLGYTIDGDTAPSESFQVVMTDGFRGRAPIRRRAVAVSPYLWVIGCDNTYALAFELLLIELRVDVLSNRLPTRSA